MRKNIKYLVVFSVFLSLLPLQVTAQEPPEPRMQSAPPPPVGLPVDDYLPLLGIAGIVYGVYLKRKAQKV